VRSKSTTPRIDKRGEKNKEEHKRPAGPVRTDETHTRRKKGKEKYQPHVGSKAKRKGEKKIDTRDQ
jgi:hypothetical protein